MRSSASLFRQDKQEVFVTPPPPQEVKSEQIHTAVGSIKTSTTSIPAIADEAADQALVAYFGSDRMLESFSDRLFTFYKLTESDRSNDSCRAAVQYAAQLCLRYGMMPGIHIYVAKRGDEWFADFRLRAWLDSANEAARDGRFRFDIAYAELTPEAVRGFTPPEVPYSPDDVGYGACIVLPDMVAARQAMSLPVEPEWFYGFWRQNGWREFDPESNSWSDWMPDRIWQNRTKDNTAKNRAAKAALMAKFSIVPLRTAYDPRSLARMIDEEIAARQPATKLPGDSAMMYTPPINRTDDGDILFA